MSQNQSKWHEEFAKNANYRIDESHRMICKCLDMIDENDIWLRPNEVSNSIGNQIVHLCGNMTQYGIASLGGQTDNRDRDREFSITGGLTKTQLLEELNKVVAEVKEVINGIGIEQLLRIRAVQSFKMSGIGVALHLVEHLSYHTGQIAFWTKILKNKNLGFYDGIDLNSRINE